MEEKYEHARFAIARYDHYYDTVNNKGAFYISLNTFMLGGLFAGFFSWHGSLEKTDFLWTVLLLFAACNLLSSTLTVIAIHPFVKTSPKKEQRSLIFFASVAQFEQENFVQAFMQQEHEKRTSDTIAQLWHLAKGLTRKFRLLKMAGWLILAQFVLLIPTIYSISKLIKP